jgi:hypothetical protein
MNFQLRNIRLSRYNDNINFTIQFVEALKNNIIYKYEYEEIIDICNLYTNGNIQEVLYINKENIDIKALESKEFKDIISKERNTPIFIEFLIKSIDENVITINIKSYSENKPIETEIYKGDY